MWTLYFAFFIVIIRNITAKVYFFFTCMHSLLFTMRILFLLFIFYCIHVYWILVVWRIFWITWITNLFFLCEWISLYWLARLSSCPISNKFYFLYFLFLWLSLWFLVLISSIFISLLRTLFRNQRWKLIGISALAIPFLSF
jgi:hypothetical protein